MNSVMRERYFTYPFPGGRSLRIPFTAMGRHITAYAIALGFKFFRDKPDAQGDPVRFYSGKRKKQITGTKISQWDITTLFALFLPLPIGYAF